MGVTPEGTKEGKQDKDSREELGSGRRREVRKRGRVREGKTVKVGKESVKGNNRREESNRGCEVERDSE